MSFVDTSGLTQAVSEIKAYCVGLFFPKTGGNVSGFVNASGEVTAHETVSGSTVAHNLTDKLDVSDYRRALTWDELEDNYTWDELSGDYDSQYDTYTGNLHLTKQGTSSSPDIGVINGNLDILDEAVGGGFSNETILQNPSGVTGGDLHVDWNDKSRTFRVYGWFDFAKTESFDSTRSIIYALPSSFPTVHESKYQHMGTPCVIVDTLGTIYGGFNIHTNKTIEFFIPHTNIVSVYLPPIPYSIP